MHYYFKCGTANIIITRYFQENNITDAKFSVGDTFFLPIGHGEWNIENYYTCNKNFDTFNKEFLIPLSKEKYSNGKKKFNTQNTNQVKAFIEAVENKAYFWVWYGTKIYIFQPIDNTIHSSKTTFTKYGVQVIVDYDNNGVWGREGEDPNKITFVKCVKVFERKDVISTLANLNSNQTYSRNTIAQINKEEEKYCNALLDLEKVKKPQTILEKLNILSPLYVETFCGLCLYELDYFCGLKGGTASGYDFALNKPIMIDGNEYNYISIKCNKDYQKGYHIQDKIVVLNQQGIYEYIYTIVQDKTKIKQWLNENTLHKYPFKPFTLDN